MKRILFVINHFKYSNGVAAALLNLIYNMDKDKYEISLLTLYSFDPIFANPIIDKVKIIPGFKFYFRGFDKLVNIVPGKQLYKYFIKEKYDLEISFQYGIPTKIIALGDNPNRICWMHTYDTEMKLKKYYMKYKKIITVAKVGRDKLLLDGFSAKMVDYCYNIIDEAKLHKMAVEEIEFGKSHKYAIITVARLNPDKACMRYIKCIKEIINTCKDVEFWIVGDGVEKRKMQDYIKTNKMDDYVKMLGLQVNPYKYMSKADLYFCASYREGFSTSCQEAALLGLPVVSTEVDGAEELIEIANCGHVIPNNSESIIKEIVSLLNDNNRIEEWKVIATKSREKFSKNARIKKAEEVFDSFL